MIPFDTDDSPDELTDSDDNETVERLGRMVAELTSLEELLSAADPLVRLAAFREWAASDSRLAEGPERLLRAFH